MSMNWRTEKWKKNEANPETVNIDTSPGISPKDSMFPVCTQVNGPDRANLIAAAPDMLRALDECDTFLAVANLTCENLTPAARSLLGITWSIVQQAISLAIPNSSMAKTFKSEPGTAMQITERRRKSVERLLAAAKALAADMDDSGEDRDEDGHLYAGNLELVEAIKEAEDAHKCD